MMDASVVIETIFILLGVISWSMPIVALTLLTFSVEHYTKFKTYWKQFLVASLITLTTTSFIGHEFWTNEQLSTTNLIGDLMLLSGTLIAAIAGLKLLKFQNLNLGKTINTIKILLVIGSIIPIAGYIFDGVKFIEIIDLIAYNFSIIFLIMVFLTIAKITRHYVPRYSKIAYQLVRIGSLVLLLDPLQRNYSVFTHIEGLGHILGGFSLISHLFADILLLPALILLTYEAKVRGIHLVPGMESANSEHPLKYRLKKGFSYLIKEHEGDESLSVLTDYITHGHHGLCITRNSPAHIRETFGLKTTPILWMTNTESDEKTVKPKDLRRLTAIINDFIRNNGQIILIQRIDYLITQNNFDQVLGFLQDISDIVRTSKIMLIIGLDTTTLTRQQQSLLSQELEYLDSGEQKILNESLYDLLMFINSENKRRKSPNIKSVTRHLDITKTTARKRVYELETLGLIRMAKEGRSKLLELTEEGKKMVKSPIGPMER